MVKTFCVFHMDSKIFKYDLSRLNASGPCRTTLYADVARHGETLSYESQSVSVVTIVVAMAIRRAEP